MILPIYIKPNPILTQKTTLVEEITPEIVALVANMRETMHNAQGIGLAAPQIGQSLAICMVEYATPDEPEDTIPYTVLINPHVTWKSQKMVSMFEGCLSIPGVEGPVQRPARVRIKAKNLQGEVVEIESAGLYARAMQHEIDHLQGILFTSYVPKKLLQPRSIVDYPRL